MGLTIHYEGMLRNEAARDDAICWLKHLALENEWESEPIDLADVNEERVFDEEAEDYVDWQVVPDYLGPQIGVRIFVHPECEPFTLAVGTDLFFQDWTKTQYAGERVHREIVHLLDRLQGYCSKIRVFDEAEFWLGLDDHALTAAFARSSAFIEEMRTEHPDWAYKVRRPDGRFIDFIQPPSGS